MDIKTVLEGISSGKFDNDLSALGTAVKDRQVHVRKNKTISDFNVGDRVKFNEQTGTRYMVGQYATVVSKNRTKLVVRLETPMGRFIRVDSTGNVKSADVTVPAGIIDLA